MQHKLFALSLGFGGLILATHHAFAEAAAQCACRNDLAAGLADGCSQASHSIAHPTGDAVPGQNFNPVGESIPAPGSGA